jgi:hypothetical protein
MLNSLILFLLVLQIGGKCHAKDVQICESNHKDSSYLNQWFEKQ